MQKQSSSLNFFCGYFSSCHCKEFFGFFVFQLSFKLIIESAIPKTKYI